MQKLVFAKYGENVYVGYDCVFTHKNIFLGNNIMFRPNVIIRAGTHRIDIVGEFMFEIKEKLTDNDQDDLIIDDVWIGYNLTVLKGVAIGKGAVVAAGALITKSVPRYAIIGGNPAKVNKYRLTDSQIKKHEEVLYKIS